MPRTAWLLVQVLPGLGLAGGFVSGYLISTQAGRETLEGPSGSRQTLQICMRGPKSTMPGAGWIGLDPTSVYSPVKDTYRWQPARSLDRRTCFRSGQRIVKWSLFMRCT